MGADWVYCHNTSDVKYYKGLGCKDVRVMRSLMIPEGLQRRSEWSGVTIIGGNFVNWYGGFDSYMVAREIGDPIVAPSMGRKQDNEDAIPDIQYLPYYSIGYVYLPATIIVGITSSLTARFGVNIAHRMKQKKLRIAFAFLVMIMALNLLMR